jgi:hypothetical protein
MKTKKINISKNTTRKNIKQSLRLNPSLNVLKLGYPLYASKAFEGSTILEYNKKQEEEFKDKCLMQNSSWFGDLNVAKSYKTKDTHIYLWKTKNKTNLLSINAENEVFINYIFSRSSIKLTPTIQLKKEQLKKIDYEHDYLKMSPNGKALYEFKFCFGFITVEEQYEFMKLIKYLIENKFIDIKMRNGKSIIEKLNMKIKYYNLTSIFGKKDKFNRLSFVEFDKHAIMNLCKLTNNNKYKISGVYQKNDTSFWFPNLIVYKMDIQEYILFNPHHNLVYDKLIE